MTARNFKALNRATAPRAKAGTPNPRSSGFGRFLVPPGATMRIVGASKLARDRGTETPYRGCLERAHSEATDCDHCRSIRIRDGSFQSLAKAKGGNSSGVVDTGNYSLWRRNFDRKRACVSGLERVDFPGLVHRRGVTRGCSFGPRHSLPVAEEKNREPVESGFANCHRGRLDLCPGLSD